LPDGERGPVNNLTAATLAAMQQNRPRVTHLVDDGDEAG
jgi:hypothetical protein